MIRNESRLEGGYLFGVNFEDEAKVNQWSDINWCE